MQLKIKGVQEDKALKETSHW